ncbi:DUF2800 domain-containing protein [Bradyrhizobium oligotrophicum S58]
MSSMFRWGSETGCTASAEAIEKMGSVVTFEDSEESEAGTAAHDELERVLKPLESRQYPLEMDGDQPAAIGIALFVSYALKLRRLYPRAQFFIERHVRLTDDIWGRLDCGCWDAETATVTIVDYKNGYVGVDAERNHQLRGYAISLIRQFNLPARHIRYAIVQPNDFRPVPAVKQWAEPIEDLEAFAARIVQIPGGPKFFRAGSHCRDCPLLGICEPTKDILAHLGAAMARGPAGDVQPAQIALFLAMQKPIDHFFEGLAKQAVKRLLAGEDVPGMLVVTGTKHRAWKSEAAAREAIYVAKGLPGLKPPTVKQAEDMGIDVTGLYDQPSGGPVLAPIGDKRKPYAPPSAEEMFKGVAAMVAAQGGAK